MSDSVIISSKQLKRGYTIGKKRIEVLHGINLDILAGENIFLCGPSGAGKTTLMYTLAGLEAPEKGTVHIDGIDIYALNRTKQAKLRNKYISYIFQNYYLLPELTALENVKIPALIGGKNSHQAAVEALKRVGLENRADHLPSELSGGEQQRVAIARAIINKPQIIFADEPTGNLDSKNGELVMKMLIDLTKEDGTTLVVVTHDSELAKLGSRTLTVKDGKIVSNND